MAPTQGIRVHAAFTQAAGANKEEAMAAMKKVIEATRKEKGCLQYELFEKVNSEGKSEFAMIEHWESKDALDTHMKTAHVKEFMDKNKKFSEGLTVGIYKSCGI